MHTHEHHAHHWGCPQASEEDYPAHRLSDPTSRELRHSCPKVRQRRVGEPPERMTIIEISSTRQHGWAHVYAGDGASGRQELAGPAWRDGRQ